jgi:hypothetical protein
MSAYRPEKGHGGEAHQLGTQEQGAQELGGVGGVGAGFCEDSPVLEVGESVLDRRPSDSEDALGFLLAGG